MAARIIHFGVDRKDRLPALRFAGLEAQETYDSAGPKTLNNQTPRLRAASAHVPQIHVAQRLVPVEVSGKSQDESTNTRENRSASDRTGAFLYALSQHARDDLGDMVSFNSVPSKTVLFAHGDKPAQVFILFHGRARIFAQSDAGRRCTLRIARSRDILGLSSALTGLPHVSTAETSMPSLVATIDRTDFQRLLRDHPDAVAYVMESLHREYNEISCRVAAISEGKARMRNSSRLTIIR